MIKISAKSNVQFRGMVPIKDYNGPVLKLTEDDIEKINKLQNSISQLEFEIYGINKLFENKKLTSGELNFYYNKLAILEYQIKSLKDSIRQIKIDRLNIQKRGK